MKNIVILFFNIFIRNSFKLKNEKNYFKFKII